jgi:hypothetical protein
MSARPFQDGGLYILEHIIACMGPPGHDCLYKSVLVYLRSQFPSLRIRWWLGGGGVGGKEVLLNPPKIIPQLKSYFDCKKSIFTRVLTGNCYNAVVMHNRGLNAEYYHFE